jgi:oxygen-independent coproporphyrinogen-3 oxidase
MTEAQGDGPFREPRAAYVHVPFCRHRCGYCNFTLVAGRDDLIDGYLRALELELASVGQAREVDTLFFGGGTPTHLPPEQLARLLSIVGKTFPLVPGGEFSVEANPLDITPQRVAVLSDHGVTRLSLGVQSFDDQKLAMLERDHRRVDLPAILKLARESFWSLSLDLIFATPGESLALWQSDLDAALQTPLDHISTYGLTWEKGTSYWSRREKGELSTTSEDIEAAMYVHAIDCLKDSGFEHYEVSNFARPGHRSRHNETYWLGKHYFAVGPGAARYVNGRRETNHRSTITWMKRLFAGESPVADSEVLLPEERARERLVFGLRRLEGITLTEFEQETGFDALQLGGDYLERYLRHGAMELAGGRLRLTRAGLLVSDALWPALLRL